MLKRLLGVAAITAVVISGTYVLRPDAPATHDEPVPEALQTNGTVDRAELERLIGVYEQRVATNETASDDTFLGRLYLQQGKLTGDLSAYTRAGEVLAASLRVFPGDAEASTLLASTKYTIHDFHGALDLARTIPGLGARSLVGDAELELGDYDGAAAIYDELTAHLPNVAAVDARRSRLAFLRGDIRSAQTFATRAAREASDEGAFGPSLAQYHTVLSTLAFERGDYDVAATEARVALASAPAWHTALAALARAQAGQGRLDDAIRTYRRSIAAVPEPGAVAALGDLLHLRGEDAAAKEQYGTVEVVAKLAGAAGVFDRQVAGFWADHDLRTADAVRVATAELARRADVYGHDTLGWALYADGDPRQARVESDKALELGTRDARLLYHAGMISAALGDRDRAARELSAALDLNPHFDPVQAPRARATLAGLR